MRPRERKFKFLAIVQGDSAREAIVRMVEGQEGKVDKITRITEKYLYEMSFYKKKSRDDFASFWRQMTDGTRSELMQQKGERADG